MYVCAEYLFRCVYTSLYIAIRNSAGKELIDRCISSKSNVRGLNMPVNFE